MTDRDLPAAARRNRRGRFVKGVSGNPAGRPRGILNRATRIAAQLFDGEAEALVRREIELALAGDARLLRHCVDRIIAPQREQPVRFALPPAGDAAGPAGAMAAVIDAATRGLISPEQAACLAQALEAQARTVAATARSEQQRADAAAPAVYSRMQLRGCVVIADGVREIHDEAGEVDEQVRELCAPILQIGRMALALLADIPDRLETVLADRAFAAVRPVPPDHPPHPLAEQTGELLVKLQRYLERDMRRLDRLIEERAAAREAAGEADPIYRSWLFQPGRAMGNLPAKST